MPDWRFQPCDFSAHGFSSNNKPRIARMNTDAKSSDLVAGGADPGNGSEPVEAAVNDRNHILPNSGKIYVSGKIASPIFVFRSAR